MHHLVVSVLKKMSYKGCFLIHISNQKSFLIRGHAVKVLGKMLRQGQAIDWVEDHSRSAGAAMQKPAGNMLSLFLVIVKE